MIVAVTVVEIETDNMTTIAPNVLDPLARQFAEHLVHQRADPRALTVHGAALAHMLGVVIAHVHVLGDALPPPH